MEAIVEAKQHTRGSFVGFISSCVFARYADYPGTDSLFPLGQMWCWHYHLPPESLGCDQLPGLWVYTSPVYFQ
jgi:hypothetical protein